MTLSVNSERQKVSTDACSIDSAIENAGTVAKLGYLLAVTPVGRAYTATNQPQTPNSSGVRYFFTDQTLVIRANPGAAATASSPSI